MDSYDNPEQQQRGTCLYAAVALGGISVFAFLLVLITGGWFLWVIGIVTAFAGFAGIHYVLWGHSMVRQTAAEREEPPPDDREEFGDWPPEDAHRIRRP
jgi:hypothetical protein